MASEFENASAFSDIHSQGRKRSGNRGEKRWTVPGHHQQFVEVGAFAELKLDGIAL